MRTISALLLSLLLLVPALRAEQHHSPATPDAEKALTLRLAVRDLWVGHIFWVRNVVLFEALKGPKAAAAEEKHAVANARAIADAVGGYYGKEAGDSVFKILASHYGAVKAHMLASIAKDKAAQDKAAKDTVAGAAVLAKFLAKANPLLKEEIVQRALEAHMAHHLAQNEALLLRDWDRDAAIWEEMRGHIQDIADMLADGIARQFPEKFAAEAD